MRGAIAMERCLNVKEPLRASSHTMEHYGGRKYEEEKDFMIEEEHHRQIRRPQG